MREIHEANDTPLQHDVGMEQLSDNDWYGMVRAWWKAAKRRAVPSWGVKAKLLLLAM